MPQNLSLTQAIVQVRNLSVMFGEYLAVENVSFELLTGTHTAIIGRNGAGKSTLIKTILGLIETQSGEIKLFDSTGKQLETLRQDIGYIPQKFLFDRTFPLTVMEFVALGLNSKELWYSRKRKKETIYQALEKVNLTKQARQQIGTLSGGELKRLLLAYCLVSPRRLLVLDEALAGVDATGEIEFAALLNNLKQEHNWTILEVSHDLDLVSKHCDSVICLNRRLLYQGAPSTILTPENLLHIYGSLVSPTCHHHEPSRLPESF
ncbi:ATPase component of Mn/Zn ABC-type transporter [Xenococcus sp. PCC 7305]|uniref:metal ABC transporter ATP-binding protein n=1 Tax=Xenococcus sp. PCC 7305 TaxID=102125 RepID=UPI0002AC2CA4|nr:metal ABC transporter ATP-binding protein [Xenococcus sp. PCC 7305]ELS00914.1 ATPase component of Mn/Zn ABC-type transporter [Xenococcus sp. PCC 7305]